MVLPTGWRERAAAKAAHKAHRGAAKTEVAEAGFTLKLARELFSHESLKRWQEHDGVCTLTVPRATFAIWDADNVQEKFQQACAQIGLYDTRLLVGGGESPHSNSFTFTIPALQFADRRSDMEAYFNEVNRQQREAAGRG